MQPTPFTTPASLALALDQYARQFLAARNLAQRTRREYTTDISQLVDFLGGLGIDKPERVARQQLEAYLAELDRRGLSGNTRRRKVAAIRSFFAFLQDAEMIPLSPALKLIPPEREQRQPRVLSEAEYQRLQLACAHETRDAAVIELLLQTGMRLSELSRLTLADIQLPTKITRDEGNVGSVRIFGKGRKERTVTLNYKACRAIKSYLAIRPAGEDEHLFITKFGMGIGPRAIQYLLRKYMDEAAISSAGVHTLRHTFATHMVRRGTKLDVVRQALGHTSLKTTSIYVDLAREVMDKELQANAL
jgi:site-specific recombinase XerD